MTVTLALRKQKMTEARLSYIVSEVLSEKDIESKGRERKRKEGVFNIISLLSLYFNIIMLFNLCCIPI